MSQATLPEQRLSCWVLARRVAQQVISTDVSADAERLFLWCQNQADEQLGFKALMSASSVRTGGSSIGQILTAAGEAYTFTSKKEVAVAPKPPAKPADSPVVSKPKGPSKFKAVRRGRASKR